jgi:hypothetical protein
MPVDAVRATIGADTAAHMAAIAIRPSAGIRADTASVRPGQSVILSWTTKNAVSAYLNGKPVPLTGSLKLEPKVSTTYRVVANSPTGATDWGAVTVSVQP